MYNNNLVAVITINDKILREDKNGVYYLPVNSEYAIRLKNLSDKKAAVSIYIDGQNILNGRKIIVGAKSSETIERFLQNDLEKGYKLKFIEKTSRIEKHRGNKIEDGIVRIEFQFEKPNLFDFDWPKHTLSDPDPLIYKYNPYTPNYDIRSKDFNSQTIKIENHISNIQNLALKCSCTAQASFMTETSSEVNGITVGGSDSNQSFKEGYISELEPTKHIICLQLKGVKETGQMVEKPLLTKEKITCPICGTKNSSKNKFCPECGTRIR